MSNDDEQRAQAIEVLKQAGVRHAELVVGVAAVSALLDGRKRDAELARLRNEYAELFKPANMNQMIRGGATKRVFNFKRGEQ